MSLRQRLTRKKDGDEPIRRKPYTLGEAAEVLTERLGYNVSHQMVWYWVKQGRIQTLPRVGDRGWHRIAVTELKRFITRETS